MREWKGEERLRGEKKMEVEREIGGERREWSGESKMEGERYMEEEKRGGENGWERRGWSREAKREVKREMEGVHSKWKERKQGSGERGFGRE